MAAFTLQWYSRGVVAKTYGLQKVDYLALYRKMLAESWSTEK